MARLRYRFFRWLGDQIHEATWERGLERLRGASKPMLRPAGQPWFKIDSSIVRALQVGGAVTWVDKDKDEHFP